MTGSVKRSPGYALLMEMGCGKTISTVAIIGRAYLNGLITRVLIIAPKSIVAVWEEEFMKFADFPNQLTILTGGSQKKKQMLQAVPADGLQIIVVT